MQTLQLWFDIEIDFVYKLKHGWANLSVRRQECRTRTSPAIAVLWVFALWVVTCLKGCRYVNASGERRTWGAKVRIIKSHDRHPGLPITSYRRDAPTIVVTRV
jgi:hypothetical protein